MKRLFLIYAASILILNPVFWGLIVGAINGGCNLVLISCGSARQWDSPLRMASFAMAVLAPLGIWPVAGAIFGADLFRWRFLAENER